MRLLPWERPQKKCHINLPRSASTTWICARPPTSASFLQCVSDCVPDGSRFLGSGRARQVWTSWLSGKFVAGVSGTVVAQRAWLLGRRRALLAGHSVLQCARQSNHVSRMKPYPDARKERTVMCEAPSVGAAPKEMPHQPSALRVNYLDLRPPSYIGFFPAMCVRLRARWLPLPGLWPCKASVDVVALRKICGWRVGNSCCSKGFGCSDEEGDLCLRDVLFCSVQAPSHSGFFPAVC